MRWLSFMLISGLFACVGCSADHRGSPPNIARVGAKIGVADGAPKQEPAPAAGEFVALQDEPKANQPPKVVQPRKIRYTANAKLIVKEFAAAEEGLKAALKEADADVAQAEVNMSPDSIRTGVWKIRVPVKNFDSFREALFALGEVEQNRVDSEDMTAEYYDLEAYIKNRMAEEEAMNKLLEKAGERDIDVFIKIKDKRDEIRRDINMKEGRRRLVANMTDLTTVNLTIREKQKNAPATLPSTAPAPATFGSRASETFGGSWELFLGFLQAVVLIILAVIPWLPVPLLFGAIVWLTARYLRGRDAPMVIEVVEQAAPSNKA